jgi:hypothetical protein
MKRIMDAACQRGVQVEERMQTAYQRLLENHAGNDQAGYAGRGESERPDTHSPQRYATRYGVTQVVLPKPGVKTEQHL